MKIVIGIFLGISLLFVAAASLFTDVKLWGAGKYVFGTIRTLPRDQRRRVVRRSAVMYLLVGGYYALFVIHPLGLRGTFLWFLIVPFLVVAPLGVLATGIRAWRQPLQGSTQLEELDAEQPGDRRG